MATTQPPKRPAQRKQSGNNFLSRMLQMEKQSKQQRASSASPTLPLSPRADCFSGPSAGASPSPTRSQRSPIPTPQSPLRPPPMPRSQPLPALAPDPKGTEKLPEKPKPSIEPLKISTSKVGNDSAAEEICLSPSRPDHGEKERRREKRRAEKEQKEQKEREKKLKHDEEKQRISEGKAGKRLSKKPPPAAMETQKMPSALRRNSWISIMSSYSTSGENARRSSREEKRLSIVSLGSFKSNRRSQSMPPNNAEETPKSSLEQWRPIVSPSAPKLPSFRWSSRKTSLRSGNSDTWGSDDAYESDLIAFAYRLEASSVVTEPEKIDQSKSKQSSRIGTQQQQPDTPAISRSSTGPNLLSETQSRPIQSPQRSTGMKDDNSEAGLVSKPKDSERQSTTFNTNDDPKGTAGHKRTPSQVPPSPQSAPLPQVRSSHDGSSYVHKQRMYQQQRYIAGFEEQQAVKAATDHATELAAEYESPLSGQATPPSERGRTPTPSMPDALGIAQAAGAKKQQESSVSPGPTKKRHHSNSLRTSGSASTKHQSHGPTPLSQYSSQTDDAEKDKEAARVRASMQNVRDVSTGKPQASTGFKRDKILGFRRRAKESPAFISVPYNTENQIVAVQSAPLDGPSSEESSPKRSKIDRIFREPRPSFAESSDRKRSSSLARNQNREEVVQSSSAQSHCRTRTSSSTVLNDNIPSPRQLPKSKTEPILTPTTKSVKQFSFLKDAQKPHSKEQPKAEANTGTKVDSPRSKHDDSAKDPKQRSNPIPSVKPASATEKATDPATTAVLEAKPTKKSPAQVILASETGDGLVRKASLTRPRSNPQLQTQTTATNSLPNLDFLPQLKHQPLVKRDRQSPTRPSQEDSTSVSIAQLSTPIAPLAYHSPTPVIAPDLKLIPRSPLRTPSQFPLPTANRHNRSATDVGTFSTFGKGALAEGLDAKPVAKLFVICCKCKFWHDLPSKLYEAMALPKELHKADEGKLTGARLATAIRCPWCAHAMNTFCCQGWTTVVYLHERHH